MKLARGLKKRFQFNAEKIREEEEANQTKYSAAVEEFTKSAPTFSTLLRSSPKEVREAIDNSMVTSDQLSEVRGPKLHFNIFRSNQQKEWTHGYLGQVLAVFFTKLNEAQQSLIVRQYYEKLSKVIDLHGTVSKQYLLAVSKNPVPFFLLPPIGPVSTGDKSNPLYVSVVTSASSFLWKLFLWLFILGIFFTWQFSKDDRGDSPLSILTTEKNYQPNPIPSIKFDNVKGNNEAKEELSDLVGYLASPSKYENVKIPKGILLSGPPGTGKTLLAKALAGEAGVPFISVSGSEFEEVFVGVGTRRMKKLFSEARSMAPCIIFIDEIDAIGGRDKFVLHENATLNQLLVELDGFSNSSGVILIGATNLPESLDKALLRPGRFDRKLHISVPDIAARKEILQYYFSKHNNISSDVDIDIIARQTAGKTGAELENMVNLAAIHSIKENKAQIDLNDVENSLLTILMGREIKTFTQAENEKKRTAYHEGGHALVALLSPHAPEIRKATILPRGQALGMVNYLEGDSQLGETKQEYLAFIRLAMGGRAAEEVIYGKDYVTTGASNDFQQATKIAHHMVTKLGMSSLGQLYLKDSNLGSRATYTEMNQKIEQEVKKILDESYMEARRILLENKDPLHRLANALMK